MSTHASSYSDRLTSKEYWDGVWAGARLPVQETTGRPGSLASDILQVFVDSVPLPRIRTVLEVGGAPGGYLCFFAKRYRCDVHALDFSDIGCRKTRENFALQELDVSLHQVDMFDAACRLPQYDLVYSLGFVEHFTDLRRVFEAHWRLVKPRGYLVVGVPHFVSVYWGLLRRMAPSVTLGHERSALDPRGWKAIEAELGMKVIRRAYLGGMGLLMIASVLEEELTRRSSPCPGVSRAVWLLLRWLHRQRSRLCRRMPSLWKLKSLWPPRLRAYGIAVYEKI